MASVHVSQPEKITYFRISKNAGILINHWFRGLIGEYSRLNCPVGEDGLHVEIQNGLLYLSEVKREGYFTFTVVRNPWDRIYSAYYDFTNPETPDDIKLKKELMTLNGWSEWPTFEQFVVNLHKLVIWPKENWNGTKSIAIVQQCEFIDTDIDLIARYENMVEDLQPVIGMFGVDFPLVPVYRDELDYRPHYTEETKNIIAELFKDDIETFGYNF